MKDNICIICSQPFKNRRSFSAHLKIHKITIKEYFDRYIKTENDGICVICGKNTVWNSSGAFYPIYCSKKCALFGYSKKYGVENIAHVKIFQKKKENTCINRYGVTTISQAPCIKQKMKDNWKQRTKEQIQNRSNKIKETCIQKYGVDSPMKVNSIKQQMHQTMLDKYGVEHALQNKELLDKAIENNLFTYKTYKLPSGKVLRLQGYEPQFLDFLFNNNIILENDIQYEPFGIEYKDINNNIRYYFPDFYISKFNLIVEVKSKWTDQFDINIEQKRKSILNAGYSYLKVIDNDFSEFIKIIDNI